MLFSRLFFCFRRMAPPDMKYQAAMTPSRNTTVCGIRRRVLLVLRVPLLSCACHGFRCQCAASILVSTCGKSLTPVHASERRLEHSADAQCIYPDAGLHTAARMGPSTAGHEDLFWWTRLRGFAAHDFVEFLTRLACADGSRGSSLPFRAGAVASRSGEVGSEMLVFSVCAEPERWALACQSRSIAASAAMYIGARDVMRAHSQRRFSSPCQFLSTVTSVWSAHSTDNQRIMFFFSVRRVFWSA